MPTKQAAAASSALVASPPQDPLDLKIKEVEQAIQEVRESRDPVYVAAPHKRIDLIEQLSERIALLKQQKADRDAAAAERAHRDQLQRNWQALAPKREALAQRWNRVRDEARAVLDEALALNNQHISRTEKRGLSENVAPITLLNARAEVVDGGVVILRPDQF
jgi:hypothetical protein